MVTLLGSNDGYTMRHVFPFCFVFAARVVQSLLMEGWARHGGVDGCGVGYTMTVALLNTRGCNSAAVQ